MKIRKSFLPVLCIFPFSFEDHSDLSISLIPEQKSQTYLFQKEHPLKQRYEELSHQTWLDIQGADFYFQNYTKDPWQLPLDSLAQKELFQTIQTYHAFDKTDPQQRKTREEWLLKVIQKTKNIANCESEKIGALQHQTLFYLIHHAQQKLSHLQQLGKSFQLIDQHFNNHKSDGLFLAQQLNSDFLTNFDAAHRDTSYLKSQLKYFAKIKKIGGDLFQITAPQLYQFYHWLEDPIPLAPLHWEQSIAEQKRHAFPAELKKVFFNNGIAQSLGFFSPQNPKDKTIVDGRYIYAIAPDQTLVVLPHWNHSTWSSFIEEIIPNHHILTHGTPVICAGEVEFTNGKITLMNNNSGHYLPAVYHLYNGVELIKKQFNGFADQALICPTLPPEDLKKQYSVEEFLQLDRNLLEILSEKRLKQVKLLI
jgi:hypothetical protein